MKASCFKKAAEPFAYLFWRAQVSVLRACPPLCGVVARVSLGAANSRAVWVKTLFHVAAQAPGAVLQHWRNQREKRVVLTRVYVAVTTRCTLRCDKCIAHVPDLKNPADRPADELVRDMRALLDRVDYIYVIYLSGGEPFLYQELDAVLRACADPAKVGDINIITNGTVVPGAKTLAALREARATVKINRYPPALQPNVEKLKAALEASGIRYTHEGGDVWRDTGEFGRLKEGSAKRRFSVCPQHLCLYSFNGKLHLCGETAFQMEEGLLPDCPGDYIDLRGTSPAQFRAQFPKLMKKRVLTACSNCLGNTYRTPRVPVAAQRGG